MNVQLRASTRVLFIIFVIELSALGNDREQPRRPEPVNIIKPGFEVCYGPVDFNGLPTSTPVEVDCLDIRTPQITIKLALPPPTLISFSILLVSFLTSRLIFYI